MESFDPKMKKRTGKAKDVLFEGEASTSFRRWNKGISASKTSELTKCSGSFLDALMSKMGRNVYHTMCNIHAESIIDGKMRITRKLATSFQNIWKEAARLRADPDLFPSEKDEATFWYTMDHFTKFLRKFQKMHHTWSYDNPTPFEVQLIDQRSLDNRHIKFCESCDRFCRLELHSLPLSPETLEKCGLVQVDVFGFEIGYVYIDFNWFDKYVGRDIAFPGPDGNTYSLSRLYETPLTTLQESRFCRWRVQSKCWHCRETWVGHAQEGFHVMEPQGPSAKKTWTKWFRNINRSYRAPQIDMLQNNCAIVQRIPPTAGMLLRRARFMYSSIGRRYETEHRDKLREKKTSAFRLAQATGENYLLLKQKENRVGRAKLPFCAFRTIGDVVGDVESIESLSLAVRSFQGRLHSEDMMWPLVMEVARQSRPQRM